jgi:hypothetical protein
MKVNDAWRPPFWTEPKRPTQEEIVEGRFPFLSFDDVDPFLLDQPLRQDRGAPGEPLMREDRLAQTGKLSPGAGLFTWIAWWNVRGADPVDDQAPIEQRLALPWTALPSFADEVDCIPVLS